MLENANNKFLTNQCEVNESTQHELCQQEQQLTINCSEQFKSNCSTETNQRKILQIQKSIIQPPFPQHSHHLPARKKPITMFIRIASQALFLLAAVATTSQGADYGLDCSFPIHNYESSCGDLLGDRKSFYEDYVEGCRQYYGPKKGKRCDTTEDDRLRMSQRQPRSMVRYCSVLSA